MTMNHFKKTAALAACLLAFGAVQLGCSSSDSDGAKDPSKISGPKTESGEVVDPEAAKLYAEGLAEMERLDKTPNGWTEATCSATAKKFLDAASAQGGFFGSAVYNAGASYHRCNNFAEARKLYKEVLDKNEKFHRARVQLARFDLAESNETASDKAMAEFQRAIQDSDFQNVEALVELARLQMRRNNNASDSDGANDFERAKKNLQRALAVDDAFMPAFNLLALYYLERAKQNAGQKGGKSARGSEKQKVDTQAIDLALLVASQGIRKNPNYASIHNTAGLIFVQSGDLNNAVRRFGTARQLDPSFFEANMNFAAVNMLFRGFGKAEEAYRAALKQKPNDYDAHLGLALALRGQIDTAPDGDKKLAEAEALINKAKTLDANRPEAYFNHAILTQEYKAKSGGDSLKALEEAIGHFNDFVKRAQGKTEFNETVDDVTAVPTEKDENCMGAKAKGKKGCKRGRIFDLKDEIAFAKESAAEQKKLAEEAKTRAAIEEAQGGAETPPE
jgi:Tfp pilus assembly protein PilF